MLPQCKKRRGQPNSCMSADKNNIVLEKCSGALGASIYSRCNFADMNQQNFDSREPIDATQICSSKIVVFNVQSPP